MSITIARIGITVLLNDDGDLFDIIAIAHPVVAQDVAVVPEFLYDCGRGHVWSRFLMM